MAKECGFHGYCENSALTQEGLKITFDTGVATVVGMEKQTAEQLQEKLVFSGANKCVCF